MYTIWPKSRNYPAAGGNYPKRKKEKGGEGEKKEKGARKREEDSIICITVHVDLSLKTLVAAQTT